MTRSLGPSNDVGCEVEIRAAERAGDASVRFVGERWGWDLHEDKGRVDSRFEHYWIDSPGVMAGWLAREIATHDDRETRDATAWPWDPTRPVAGQYEEWLAEVGHPTDPSTKFEERAAQMVVPVDRAEAPCVCGHAREEHGQDPDYPGSAGCRECGTDDCIAYEEDR